MLPPGATGAGAVCPAGAGPLFSRMDVGARFQLDRMDIRSAVAKNSAPRMAVARESAFAWPRPVMKLPVPPPVPSAPPSERCRRTTPISATTIRM